MDSSRKLYYSTWAIFIFFALGIIGIHLWLVNISFAFPVLEQLNDFQRTSLELLVERIKLLSGLATLFISASFIMLGAIKKNLGRIDVSVLPALGAISVWFLSIICGYFSYSVVIDMVHNKTYELNTNLVVVPSTLQFFFLILGLPFLLHGVFRILTGEKGE